LCNVPALLCSHATFSACPANCSKNVPATVTRKDIFEIHFPTLKKLLLGDIRNNWTLEGDLFTTMTFHISDVLIKLPKLIIKLKCTLKTMDYKNPNSFLVE